MRKLLDDAKAAGFDVESDKVISDTFHINITEKLAKFAALQIPEGYKLMPLKLTDKMKWAASLEMPLHHGRLDKMYDAMIANSPPTNTEDE